jgi:23S rRNA (uracil1939-C5)-methyltransferase
MTSPRPRSIPVARGDELEVEVSGLGDGPDGIARLGDYVLFVPGVLPGERALVRVTSAARKFGRAEALARHGDAGERVVPHCRHFGVCGGCHRQHQVYDQQLRDKQDRLQRAVRHGLADGGAAAEVAPTIAARPPYGHRHKVVVHLRDTPRGGLEACFHRLRSPELITVHECPASDPLAWDLAQDTIELLHDLPHGAWDPDFAPNGLLRSVLVRATTVGEAHVLLVARDAEIPGLERLYAPLHEAGATSISTNANRGEFSQLLGAETVLRSGPPRIRERLAGIDYLLGADTFFQTSPQAAEQLVQLVVEWLAPGADDVVGDLYCGGGLLTLPLARRCRTAFGVERSLAAIRDAEAASRANEIRNVLWRAGHVESWLARCRAGELPRPTLVAVDPPRTGLPPVVVDELRRLAPRRLAYVSCDPQALQRDLQPLHDAGFVLQRVVPIDMFPQTCHVEAVASFARQA